MLARGVPEVPLPPVVLDYDKAIYAATDGSAVDTVAAWVVAFEGNLDFSLNVAGEDQTPFRAEVEGLLAVARALGRYKASGVVHVLSDCTSALTTVQTGGKTRWLGVRALDLFESFRGRIEVQLWWIPSHGKIAPACWTLRGNGCQGFECPC